MMGNEIIRLNPVPVVKQDEARAQPGRAARAQGRRSTKESGYINYTDT